MTKGKSIYKSYLLRLWWKEDANLCRISLEEVKEQSPIIHFADIASFVGFLQRPLRAGVENKNQGERQT